MDGKDVKDATSAAKAPLREEYMAMKGAEYYREWVKAGKPRKAGEEKGAA